MIKANDERSAWEIVYDGKPVEDIDDIGRVKCICGTYIIHEVSISDDQNNVK